jgi:hypothetical protein
LFPTEHQDKRLNQKDLAIGVRIGDPHKEYITEADLRKSKQKGNWKLIQDTIGEIPMLVYHDPDNYTSAV